MAGDHVTNDNTLSLTGTAEAGATVKVYDGATLLGSAVATSAGAWSFTTGTLNDGAHNLTATATDVAGNTGPASSALAVTVDTGAPVAPAIDSETIVNANQINLVGTAEAGSTITVYDGTTVLGNTQVDANGAWSFTSAALFDGSHSLSVTATDAAGNVSAASSDPVVTIDTDAPVAPAITAFSNDSGVAGDHITNDNTLSLTGTAEAGATMKIYDGATLLGSAVATSTGAWSFTTGTLADGAHNLTATATDVAGNTGPASSTLAVTVDTSAPVAPAITSETIANTNHVVLTGTAEAGSTVDIYDGTSTLHGSVLADDNGAWSVDTGALAAGDYGFIATATDLAGNVSLTSTEQFVSIDGSQPELAFNVDNFYLASYGIGLLRGTAQVGSTISVSDASTGMKIGGTNLIHTDNSWALCMSDLQNSIQNFAVQATDQAGQVASINVVFGTSGHDTIVSTGSNETLSGNGGGDTFIFAEKFGNDIIADFNTSNDVIQLSHNAFADFASVLSHAAQSGADVVINADATDSITLKNTTIGQLSDHNFHLV